MSSCGQQVDPLLELFRSRGHDLKREGSCYKTRCPFHQDDTPSLSVEPAKGLWHCFGCGIGGDGITFLEKTHGLNFGQAADLWRELSGEEPKYRSASDRSPSPYLYKDHLTMNRFAAAQPSNGTHSAQPHSTPAGLTSEDLALFRRLQDIYAKELATSEKGRAYLKERGITDPETIRAFGLGYVSGSSLPQMSKAQTRRLQDLGILNSKGNEAFYNCIVCPLHDVEGNIITFWARSCATAGSPCGRRQVEKGSRHRALPTQENTPFAAINWQAARGSRRVILVEGFLDALACYQAGLRNVIPLGAAHAKLGFAQFLQLTVAKRPCFLIFPILSGFWGASEQVEELGAGGFGVVYRIRHRWLETDFALKVHSPFGGDEDRYRNRFIQEAKILFRLNHPNIVRVYDIHEISGRPCIRMELVEGETLYSAFEKYSLFPAWAAKVMAQRIAEALKHAHSAGIVHRDLKPSNIMIRRPMIVKVLDFGLGAFVERELVSRITRTGEHVAAGLYTAPELVANPMLLDPRSDLYSLGAVWYHSLVGLPPSGSDVRNRLVEVREDLPPEYVDVVLRCLANAEKRYATAQELLDAISFLQVPGEE